MLSKDGSLRKRILNRSNRSIDHQLAILADDLTSATDCGIRFALQGLATFVILNHWSRKSPGIREANVIAIDTDTRNKTADEAYKIVKEAALRTCAEGYCQVYKSVDSTLRGNLGSEIDAVMDVYGFTSCVVAPAFPYYGRTTVNGRQFVKGVPLTSTEFAKDPKNPLREDNLIKLLSNQSKRKVGLVELSYLRNGVAAVSKRVTSLRGQGVDLIVFDAMIEDDLWSIVQTFSKNSYNLLWVGSTGLARHLSQAFEAKPMPITCGKNPSLRGPGILISGTTSETTRKQLRVFKRETKGIVVEMKPLEIISSGRKAKMEMQRCKLLLFDALARGNDVVLQVPTLREVVEATKIEGRKMGIVASEIPVRISHALAKTTREVTEAFELRGLIVTGGDTAKMVCDGLGGVGIELLEEVEPGIPLGRLFGDIEVIIVTKAGGFGSPKVLVKAMNMLKART